MHYKGASFMRYKGACARKNTSPFSFFFMHFWVTCTFYGYFRKPSFRVQFVVTCTIYGNFPPLFYQLYIFFGDGSGGSNAFSFNKRNAHCERRTLRVEVTQPVVPHGGSQRILHK